MPQGGAPALGSRGLFPPRGLVDEGTREDTCPTPGPEQEGAGSPAAMEESKPVHRCIMGTDTGGLWRAGATAHGTAPTPQDPQTAIPTVHLPNPATQRLQGPAPRLQPASLSQAPATEQGSSSRRASPAGGRWALWLPRLTTFPPAPPGSVHLHHTRASPLGRAGAALSTTSVCPQGQRRSKPCDLMEKTGGVTRRAFLLGQW